MGQLFTERCWQPRREVLPGQRHRWVEGWSLKIGTTVRKHIGSVFVVVWEELFEYKVAVEGGSINGGCHPELQYAVGLGEVVWDNGGVYVAATFF